MQSAFIMRKPYTAISPLTTLLADYAITHNLTPFISMQNHYSLIYREEEREMFPTLEVCLVADPVVSSIVLTILSHSSTALRRGLDPVVSSRPRAARAPRRRRLGDDARQVGQVDLAAPDRRRGRHPPEVRLPPCLSLPPFSHPLSKSSPLNLTQRRAAWRSSRRRRA